MGDTKHTPGPWSMSRPPYDSVPWLHVYGPADSNGIARHIMHADRSYDEKLASAHLIAAAPDLYEALAAILADCGDTGVDGYVENSLYHTEVEAARAAVAKARGEA